MCCCRMLQNAAGINNNTPGEEAWRGMLCQESKAGEVPSLPGRRGVWSPLIPPEQEEEELLQSQATGGEPGD